VWRGAVVLVVVEVVVVGLGVGCCGSPGAVMEVFQVDVRTYGGGGSGGGGVVDRGAHHEGWGGRGK